MSARTDTTLNDLMKRIRHSNRVCEKISRSVKSLREERKLTKAKETSK